MNIVREARALLLENRRTTEGHQYTVPSADHYPYQWLWDSCFHAIVLARTEPEAAKAELRSLLSKQFKNGLVPHIIYWQPGILNVFKWGVEGTSSLTQPPMIAFAAREIHRRSPDTVYLRSLYPALAAYYRFLIRERDPNGHHLVSIINPDESGEDNSPRFDRPLDLRPDVSLADHLAKRTLLVDRNRECNFDAGSCMRDFFWVKDAQYNAILVENLRALAEIAELAGESGDGRFFRGKADDVSLAMRGLMFEDGVYYSTMGEDFTKLKVATWAHFAPLFAGLYSPEEARSLIAAQFRNPDTFAAPFGIRTVSKAEPSYRPDTEGFSWRGPVWMASHWFIYRGLMRYGFADEADEILEKSETLLQKSGFRECFNPETGEGYGARKFTWGALVLDMIQE